MEIYLRRATCQLGEVLVLSIDGGSRGNRMDAAIVASGLGTSGGATLSLATKPWSALLKSHTHSPVYVINLPKDVVRWRRIEASLRALGISPIRIRAVDGANKASLIRKLVKQQFGTADWTLTSGEVGCALSHIGVWKKVARDGLPAVILEDDVEIPSSFQRFYSEELPMFLSRCDIVKFEGLFFKQTSMSGPTLCNSTSTKLIVSFRPTLGAAGYALTRRGAEALLSRASKIRVSLPIDHLLVRYDEHGAIYGETRPLMVRQASEVFASNIDAERLIEGQRMKKILNSQREWIRQIRRSAMLIRRGIRRSIAMLRIVVIARFFSSPSGAVMRQIT